MKLRSRNGAPNAAIPSKPNPDPSRGGNPTINPVTIRDDDDYNAVGVAARGSPHPSPRGRSSAIDDGDDGRSPRIHPSPLKDAARSFLSTATFADATRAYGLFVASVVVLYILDWNGVLYFRPAERAKHQLRTLLHDRTTLRMLEETAGVKVMSVDEYDRKVRETEELIPRTIARYEGRIRQKDEELRAIADKIRGVKLEREALVSKFDELAKRGVGDGASNVHLWCDGCIYQGRIVSCGARLDYITKRYAKTTWQAKVEIMEGQPACVLKGPPNATAILKRGTFWPP